MLIGLMTRIPESGLTKTRLETHFTKDECALLHSAFIKDMIVALNEADANYQIFYDVQGDLNKLTRLFSDQTRFVPQQGTNLGEKMLNAVAWGFSNGHSKVALLGTDIPSIKPETIKSASNLLDNHDVVIGPTKDGGYYFIGMNKLYRDIFLLKEWGNATVFQRTITILKGLGLKWALLPHYRDIDYFDDLLQLWQDLEQGQLKFVPQNTYKLLKSLKIEQRE